MRERFGCYVKSTRENGGEVAYNRRSGRGYEGDTGAVGDRPAATMGTYPL